MLGVPGKKRPSPACSRNTFQGVGKLRALGCGLPSRFWSCAPSTPHSGWASMWASDTCKASGDMKASVFSSSTYGVCTWGNAALLARPNPTL